MSDLTGLAGAVLTDAAAAGKAVGASDAEMSKVGIRDSWEGEAGQSADREYQRYLTELRSYQSQVANTVNALQGLPAAVAQAQARKAAAEALQTGG